MEETCNEGISMAICNTFCRRVHEHVPQAGGDIVTVDAASNLDRHDTKLFHLVCPSPTCGLPLGNILLFKSILPHGAFFWRGPIVGPKIIVTDDL